jgi:tocopherol O-methyltransferase
MHRYNDKRKIIAHYDVVSPYYRTLWGEHLHHGYWATGAESPAEAQLALTAYLAEAAQIPTGAAILDVGCGFGGSSIYLAKTYWAMVTGITISSVQAAMARQAADRANVRAQFLVMDADHIALRGQFDVVWSIEAIAHFAMKAHFFAQAAALLKPGGTLALLDWFKQPDLTAAQQRAYIAPIERGMLVELQTMTDYTHMIRAGGLDSVHRHDLSARCAKTWDVSITLIKQKALWQLARAQGLEFLRFLRSFQTMQKAFASGSLVYGMLVARKPSLRE